MTEACLVKKRLIAGLVDASHRLAALSDQVVESVLQGDFVGSEDLASLLADARAYRKRALEMFLQHTDVHRC